MAKLTESERQVLILEALPDGGDKIRVSNLCADLHMSPRTANFHLQALSNLGLIQVQYFPGERAPIRQVWLTNPRERDTDIKNPPPRMEKKQKTSPGKGPLSRRRKIKNKTEELLN